MSTTIGIKEALIEYLQDHVLGKELTKRQVGQIEKLFVDNSFPQSNAGNVSDLIFHLREVTIAANRMRDKYSEGDDAVKNGLWKDLHTKADKAREFLDEQPIAPVNSNAEITHLESVIKELELKIFELKDNASNIALEFNNTALYAHSHKLTRFELKAELHKIYDKYKLWSYQKDEQPAVNNNAAQQPIKSDAVGDDKIEKAIEFCNNQITLYNSKRDYNATGMDSYFEGGSVAVRYIKEYLQSIK